MAETLQGSNGTRAEKVAAAGAEFHVVKGGGGKPLLVLHDELGDPGWLKWNSALARDRTLLIPGHPGFGRTPRLEWVNDMRDLAAAYAQFVRDLGMAPVDVVGFSLGGWLAAEMAAADPKIFRRMVLVGATGMRPPQGEILDLFNYTGRDYLKASVVDWQRTAEYPELFGGAQDTFELLELWEEARSEAARLAWRPYMYSDSLPQRLKIAVKNLPTLLLWGAEDKVVPTSSGEAYHAVIGESKLVVLPRAGHRPEIEQPEEFVKRVREFLA